MKFLTLIIFVLQVALKGKVSEFDAYILFVHKNAIQILVPEIGQQLTLYLDEHIKDFNKKKKESEKARRMGVTNSEMEFEEEKTEDDLPKFQFNEKVKNGNCKSFRIITVVFR